jgi:hypothetical protein
MSNEFENYGDVNPLMHGGIWVKDIGNNEFEIIRNNLEDNNNLIDVMLVNISDDWIEKNKVMSYIGMTEDTFDPIQYAIGCTEYYSPNNFGHTYDNMTEEQMIQFLKLRGIEI